MFLLGGLSSKSPIVSSTGLISDRLGGSKFSLFVYGVSQVYFTCGSVGLIMPPTFKLEVFIDEIALS